MVFATHANDLANGFNYDDQYNIVENPNYRGLGLTQLRWMFTTFHMGHYQPLSWVTLGLDYVLWGENPRGYHLTNVILHVANALLVYMLALTLLRSARASARPTADREVRRHLPEAPFALLAALLFAMHPLRVESVAWVTERRDVLSSFFLLLATLFYLHAHGGAGIKRPMPWVALALLAYACSLLSRALGVTFPVVLLLLDWYPLRRLGGLSAWRVYVEKVPFLLLASVFVYTATRAAHSSGASATLTDLTFAERTVQACYGLVFYLWKTVAPFGLSPLYEIPATIVLLSAKYLLPPVLVLLALVVLIHRGRRWPWLAVVSLLYAVLLGPVLGLLQAGPQEVADRYSYLPSIPWALLAAAGLLQLWQRPRGHGLALGCTALSGLLIIGLAALTWRQNQVWRTPESLWSQAVRYAPSPTAYCALAGTHVQAGRTEEAIRAYRAALNLDRSNRDALRGLAKTLTDVRQLDEAEQICGQILRYDPNDSRAHFQLASIFRVRRDLEQAIQHYTEAARLDPKLFEAHLNLGGALAERGRTDEAIAELRQALALQPKHAGARYNLAMVLMARGESEAAIGEYRQALAVRPDFPEARLNLARALERSGQRDAALGEIRAVLEVHPDHREARQLLDSLLAAPAQAP